LPWPKPWQNLRSSRETELTEDFPLHVVTAWSGNTEAVAKRHYLQVTEDHFSKAAKSGAESGAVAVQKAVQQPAMSSGSESQETKQALAEQELVRSDAGMCDGVPYHLVGVTGFEPVTSAM
jgi:glutamate synthase domain-containing protein 2